MGIGNLRNKPCKCGSGKKYKKCHMLIEWENQDKVRKEQAKKLYTQIFGGGA